MVKVWDIIGIIVLFMLLSLIVLWVVGFINEIKIAMAKEKIRRRTAAFVDEQLKKQGGPK